MAESPFSGPHPYRESLAAGVGAGLAAGALVATVDIATTAGGAASMGFAPALLGLYALPALLLGVVVGLIGAAIRTTWGEGAIGGLGRALRSDRDRDAAVTGALLSGVVMAPVLALFIARAAMGLIAERENKDIGALLLGLVVAGALPVFGFLALPVFRVMRRVARVVPPIGRAPSALVVLFILVLGVIGAALAVVFLKLEWRAINLPAYAMLAALPLMMLVWGWVWYGPLDAVRRRIPGRGGILAGAMVVALLLPVLTLRGTPSAETVAAVTQHSAGGGQLVAILRGLIDRDKDGFSAFFGGPDCNDHKKLVHPGAEEVAGNGIDDNCLDGDRPLPATAGGGAGSGSGAGSAGEPPAGSGSGTGTGSGAGSAPGAVDAGSGAVVAPGPRKIAFDGNLLFIVVDTVRADRIGAAEGYQRNNKSLTPRLDAFAAESAYFTRTYAQAPNTPRSMPSFFTSRYPSQVKVDKVHKNFPLIDNANEMLFETLQAHDLHTTSISSHFYFQPERTNFLQGFDVIDNEGALDIAGSNKDIAAPRLVPKVEAQLAAYARSKQRFGMFVHLFEPHSTYMEHDGPDWAITESGTDALAQKYDYEIAFVDGYIGKILDALATNGLDENTMVVILSDHGEAFGDHRFAGKKMFFHGQTLYDELLRVPVMIHVPGVAPRRVDAVTELIDVAPTVLDVLGIAAPASYMGRSLVPGMLGEGLPERPAHAELLSAPSWDHSAKAMVSGDGAQKVIYVSSENRFEVYDLKADAGETRNLLDKDPLAGAALKTQLTDWIEVELPAGASR